MVNLYNKDTVYVVGHGKTSSDNAITEQFKIFFLGFVIDVTTDKVIDLGSSTTVEVTSNFIKSIFIGKSFKSYNEEIEKDITIRYFGSSQKAIITAYKDALKKYESIKAKYYQ
jgi:hypothetical protein